MSGPALMIYNGSTLSLSNSSIFSIAPDNQNAAAIEVYNIGSSANISSSTISDIADSAIQVVDGDVTISGTSIHDATYGVESYGSAVAPNISNSAIYNISQYAALTYPTLAMISAENNYWGDQSGPYEPDTIPLVLARKFPTMLILPIG